jgi:hypothetical protein
VDRWNILCDAGRRCIGTINNYRRDYFKISKAGKKIVEIGSKAEKLEFSITHAEQLRLVYLKRN